MAAGQRIAIRTIHLKGLQEPRLRFDRTAVGLVRRLQKGLARSVPDGKTVIVTVTAPIRQAFKTGAVLQERIRSLLAAGKNRLGVTIHGNRIQVRVLKCGTRRTPKLIGFVHNPQPNPRLLFELAAALLAHMVSDKRARGERLRIVSQSGPAPVGTIQQVCAALRARTAFKRILFQAERD